ncbi:MULTISPECIES: DUF1893 domain-containing protein [unclassified Sedimentibacter]|uniref:DUF1893 domain-containing protein n=1 Tax=unclassified Sedimentibacter TaxID=2649220 RepID=UPI0027DF7867|nr:DUF1893 domain-containing protein [Sedimentibacter sp. MB35-C1]WMJ77889.1 DUF1893 domain-containing protein [Sedimentibacter sp. MB35-C1]
MKDITIASELLEKDNLTLVIIKNGKTVFSSRNKGIEPLYTAVMEHKLELEGSSVADRVTGKAAAMICKYAAVKELKTGLISDNAIKVLKETNIIYEYETRTSFIKNRDKTGMCPIETLSLDTKNSIELLKKIEIFLDKIKNKEEK